MPPPGPPFVITSANNGLSVDPISGKIVLGQSLGAVGDPAGLLDAREIPMNGFPFQFDDIGGGNKFLLIDQTNGLYELGDIDGAGNNIFLIIDDTNLDIQLGDINGVINGTFIEVNVNAGEVKLVALDGISGASGVDVLNNPFVHSVSVNASDGSTGSFALFEDVENLLIRLDDGNSGLFFNYNFQTFALGNFTGVGNGNLITVDDTNSKILIANTAGNAIVNINGADGFTGTVTPVTSITVDGGIVTAVS